MSTTVQAYAAKSAKAALEPFSYEAPPLASHEVEIVVTHGGICHSDIAMIDNDWRFSSYPLVPGHEVIGTVGSIGEDVVGLQVGQRVGLGWQCGSCGECEYCRRGKEQFCAKEKDTIVGRFGGWASSVRCDGHFAVPIPDGLESAFAAPLMCAGSTVFGPILHEEVSAMMRTAVVGVGGLGHLAIQFLAAFGCDVTAISSTHAKEEEARKFGARHFIASKEENALKEAAGSFDFILVTASGDVNWGAYLNALRPEGKLVICGIPESDISLSALGLIQHEKSVMGGRATNPLDVAQMLAFCARTGVKPMIEKFPFEEINAAVDHVRAGKARYRAVLEM